MKKTILLILFLVVLSSFALAEYCELPPKNPSPNYPKITILSPLEGETYSYREIFTEVISNQEIDYWGYILNGEKYTSFNPNKTITYPEGENLMIVYGSNDKGIARDYVRFYVVLNGEPPTEPYCGDGICDSEDGENWQNCPSDCDEPTNGTGDDDEDDEKYECCCCTSQGYVEYGTPYQEDGKMSFISSGNVVNNEPVILNQTFGSEKNREIGIYILIGLLILLALLMIVWLISRN